MMLFHLRHSWLLRLLGKAAEDPSTQIRIHKFFICFWFCNMVGASVVFFAFPNLWATASIFYVVWISLYANFATDYDALSASQASLHGVESRDVASGVAGRIAVLEADVARFKADAQRAQQDADRVARDAEDIANGGD